MRLPLKAPLHLLVRQLGPEHDLQRHLPVEPTLAHPIHHAHAAAGDLLEQLVVPGAAPRRLGRSRWCNSTTRPGKIQQTMHALLR